MAQDIKMDDEDGRSADALVARLSELAQRLSVAYDTRPVSKAEWDAACGDEE